MGGTPDLLFVIDPRPYEAALRQAEANALRDAAARDQARSQERRYQELLAKNFVSKEAYAQIRTNAATAEATAKASQAAQRYLPIDGWPWSGELARFCLVWLTFVLAGVLVTTDSHISIEMIDLVPGAAGRRGPGRSSRWRCGSRS